jgi:hypothetical protein
MREWLSENGRRAAQVALLRAAERAFPSERSFANERVVVEARQLVEQGRALAGAGLMGVMIPEEMGGLGLGNVALSLVVEEVNRACASTGVTVSVHASLCTGPILRFANEEQKRRFLPRLARLEILGAYAISEPEHGSDAAGIEWDPDLGRPGRVVNDRGDILRDAPGPASGARAGVWSVTKSAGVRCLEPLYGPKRCFRVWAAGKTGRSP